MSEKVLPDAPDNSIEPIDLTDLNELTNQISTAMNEMTNELIAAFIFEQNLNIAPTVVTRDVYKDGKHYTFVWPAIVPGAKPLTPEVEMLVGKAYLKYSQGTEMPIPAKEAAVVCIRKMPEDGGNKITFKFELAFIRKSLAMAALKIPVA